MHTRQQHRYGLIASADRTFIATMTAALQLAGFEVYVATSCWESERLNCEVEFAALVIDPKFI